VLVVEVEVVDDVDVKVVVVLVDEEVEVVLEVDVEVDVEEGIVVVETVVVEVVVVDVTVTHETFRTHLQSVLLESPSMPIVIPEPEKPVQDFVQFAFSLRATVPQLSLSIYKSFSLQPTPE